MSPTTNKGRGWGKDIRCGRGHDLLKPGAVLLTSSGGRKCRECLACWERERYAKRKARLQQEQTA